MGTFLDEADALQQAASVDVVEGVDAYITSAGSMQAVAEVDVLSGVVSPDTVGQPGGPAGPLNPDGTLPSTQLHYGSPGDPAGPLDGTGKIPANLLPPLDHDVGQAANEAGMLALAVTAPAVCIRTDFTPAHVFYLTADPASTLANWVDTGEFGAGAANPTAKVGLVAVNGVANSFTRSDGAPAIDAAMAPTWTGAHTFAAVSTATAPSAKIASTNPQSELSVTNAPADAKRWNWATTLTTLALRALNDAGTVISNAWVLTRAAGVVTQQQWLTGGVGRITLSQTDIVLQPPTSIETGADGSKLWLAKYRTGTGHNNAPTAIGAAATYMYVGGREYGNGGYGGIGFSYVGSPADHPAVWIGWQERNTAGNTNGDFVIATRSVTTNTAPTERLRITNLGAWALGGLANTGVAGQVITSTGAGTPPTWQTPAAAGGGNIGAPVTHTAQTVSLTPTDVQMHLVDCTAGDVVLNLPDALDSTPAGKVFTIKKIDASANGVTIDGGEANLDGQASQGLAAQWSVITVVFDGTNYQIMNRNGS